MTMEKVRRKIHHQLSQLLHLHHQGHLLPTWKLQMCQKGKNCHLRWMRELQLRNKVLNMTIHQIVPWLTVYPRVLATPISPGYPIVLMVKMVPQVVQINHRQIQLKEKENFLSPSDATKFGLQKKTKVLNQNFKPVLNHPSVSYEGHIPEVNLISTCSKAAASLFNLFEDQMFGLISVDQKGAHPVNFGSTHRGAINIKEIGKLAWPSASLNLWFVKAKVLNFDRLKEITSGSTVT